MGNSAWSVAAPFKGVMKQIAEVTVGAGGVASIDFQNIPAEYTQLVIMGNLRTEAAAIVDNVMLRFNNDSGNSYSWIDHYAQGDTAAANPIGTRASSSIRIGTICGANGLADSFSFFEASILNYANTDMDAECFSHTFSVSDNSADNVLYIAQNAGHWDNKTAVNRVTIFAASDIAEYSVLTLYGIKEDPGGMNGPGSSTDNANPRWDGTNGRKFQDGKTIEDDAGIRLSSQSAGRARAGSTQVVTPNTWTKVTLTTENYDVQNEFDVATNYRFTATVAGKYVVTGICAIASLADAKIIFAVIYVNGSIAARASVSVGAAGAVYLTVADILDLAATDYVELYIRHNDGVDRSTVAVADSYNFLAIHKVDD